MGELVTIEVGCPYCGETIELIIDPSGGVQKYIEDCEVCCRPMTVSITIGNDGAPIVSTKHEDD